MRSLLAATIAAFSCVTAADAAIRYVNADLASGANDGTSWENAYLGPQALKAAMDAAVNGDEVWTAKGTYKASTNVRTVSHLLKNGVKVYGGFAGSERALAERDPVANLTRISGDLAGNDGAAAATYSENSHHLVTSAVGTTGLLDGFELRGGNANGAGPSNLDKGGAIICLANQSPTFQTCRFIDNRCTFGGGAGYLLQSSPKFFDCSFELNQGGAFGGAFDSANATQPVFERCRFVGNKAQRAGALEFFGGSQPKVTNCLFHGNQATGAGGGGAIWLGSNSSGTFRMITVTGNSATSNAGGVLNTGGTSSFINCISWGNTGPGSIADNGIKSQGGTSNITFSDVQGLLVGAGNLNVDPQFEDPAAANYRLKETSPLLDIGSNAAVLPAITTDLDGLPRIVNIPDVPVVGSDTPIVDIGAYERQLAPPPACSADLNGSAGVDAADLAILLGAWGTPDGDLNGSGSTDAADLAVLLGAWGACP